MSVNDDFMQTLAGCADVCANLDLSDDQWMPPDGEYDVRFSSLQTGSGKKVKGVFVKPIFTILEGEFEGKPFTDYYFIVPKPDPDVYKEIAPLKTLAQFATCLAGREVKDAVEAIGVLRGAEGEEFLTVEIYRTKAKNGKIYPHIRFLSRLESAEIDDSMMEEVEEADVDPAVAE